MADYTGSMFSGSNPLLASILNPAHTDALSTHLAMGMAPPPLQMDPTIGSSLNSAGGGGTGSPLDKLATLGAAGVGLPGAGAIGRLPGAPGGAAVGGRGIQQTLFPAVNTPPPVVGLPSFASLISPPR